MPVEGASRMWRSEDMKLVEVVMQREAVFDTASALADVAAAQLVDLNTALTAFQRPFAQDVRRCEDMERRLRFMEEHLRQVSSLAFTVGSGRGAPSLDQLETILEENETSLREALQNEENLIAERNRCREQYELAARGEAFVRGSVRDMTVPSDYAPSLVHIAGVIPTHTIAHFERMVYRVSRGNSFVRSEEIDEAIVSASGDEVFKSVFVVFMSSRRVADKVRRLCDTQGATVYNITGDIRAAYRQLEQQLHSMDSTLTRTRQAKNRILEEVAQSFEEWVQIVRSNKVVFAGLGNVKLSGSTATARMWVPTVDRHKFDEALERGVERSGASARSLAQTVPTDDTHPTLIRTGKVTSSFQGIVDSYGVPRYKEVNPGVLTIVTFPYLFGIMFGDMGHGTMLTVFAALLIYNEKKYIGKPLNEIFEMIFGGRYLLLGMGLFATYIGILYNDFFGISVELFTTGYQWPELTKKTQGIMVPSHPNGKPSVKPLETVAFGIDSSWAETENKLEFYNSVKMKCSVIIGVIQMTVGLFMGLMNHIRRKDRRHMLFQFVPELLFMSCTFGYMCFLIILKWLTVWKNTHLAPSLLETMTNFFLAPGTVTVALYPGQAGVQVILLLVAFAMVPLMLVPIPYLENKQHKRWLQRRERMQDQEMDTHGIEVGSIEFDDDQTTLVQNAAEDKHMEHFDMNEVTIHYIIHTIEFVLGCVSNTASYLRLWALSLAHAELSEVFMNFSFMASMGMDSGNGFALYAGFGVWLGATIGILLLMESLSAFLHALRLHWVEFQNKFYVGDGKAFDPLDASEAKAFRAHFLRDDTA